MKIGDVVKCRGTRQIGIIVGIATCLSVEWATGCSFQKVYGKRMAGIWSL